jgi:hypothetical protein
MLVPFGEWTPDQPDLGTAVADANNVIPAARSYRPWTDTANYSTAIAARCQGATSGNSGDGTVFTFAGDVDSLYRLSGTTWTELSKPGGYTTGAEETWRFVQFGQKVLATNGNDPIQSFSLGATGTFLDLATAAPKARHMALIDPGFLMVGNVIDSSTGVSYPNRVQWAAIEDPTNWPPPAWAKRLAASLASSKSSPTSIANSPTRTRYRTAGRESGAGTSSTSRGDCSMTWPRRARFRSHAWSERPSMP